MGATAIALTLGIAAGLLAGGRPSDAASATFRLWPALVAGIVLQAVPELLGVAGAAALVPVACSYLALATFAAANLRIVGMPIVLVGLLLNAAAIIPNGGMPVRSDALVDAGIVAPEEVPLVDLGSKRHLERDDDVLVGLGDVIPVPALREVLSVGDLVVAAGLAAIAFRLLRPRRARAGRDTSHRLGHEAPPPGSVPPHTGLGPVAPATDDPRLPEGR